MKVDVQTQIEINRPVHEVWSFASDPENAPKWYKNIDSVVWVSLPPMSVGSKIAFTAKFMGREMWYTYEITTLIPDEKLVMKTSEGPFPMQTEYVLNKTAGGHTRLTLRNFGNPTGFSVLIMPLMTWMMRRANRNDLKLLKEILEG